MRTVAELTSWIEDQFPVGASTGTPRSVTGEPYVVIGAQYPGMPVIPGTVDEGQIRELAFDEETACYQARVCFSAYAQDRRGTLYWRVKPQLEFYGRRCALYMRCLISDKPAQLQ